MTYYDNLFLLIFFISEPAGSKDSHIDFTLLIYNAITPLFIAREHSPHASLWLYAKTRSQYSSLFQ